MNKVVLNIIRIVCLVLVASFFLSYFVVSCEGREDINLSGFDAAVGNKEEKIDPNPFLFLIPGVALILLVLISLPSIRKKMLFPKRKISFIDCITIIGSIIGLILLYNAYNSAIGEVKRAFQGYGIKDISKYFHTGLGFKISIGSYIAMFVMSFVDIFLPKK